MKIKEVFVMDDETIMIIGRLLRECSQEAQDVPLESAFWEYVESE